MASSSCSPIMNISLLLLIFITLFRTSHASLNATLFVEQVLESHNTVRQAVGVPPLVYEPLLARVARIYADERRHDCKLVHSPGYKFGENLFWGQGHNYWTVKDAVGIWAAEKKYYSYEQNTCINDKECSHYTQIVWRTTIRVGCAQVICDSGDTFIACEYYPAGNYVGARPYEIPNLVN